MSWTVRCYRHSWLGLWAAAGACLSITPAAGELITVGASKDGTLIESATGALSNGGNNWLFVGRVGANGGNTIRRGLIAFDVSAIPPGSTINSVALTLHLTKAASNAQPNRIVSVHRLNADWGEGTASDVTGGGGGGAASQEGDATWIHRFKGTANWATPGGDFNPTASAAVTVGLASPFVFHTWSGSLDPPVNLGLVEDVQHWVDSPTENFGWLLRGDESVPRTAKRFDSRTHPNVSFRPQLTIDYTPPSLTGDINGDQRVDLLDVTILANHYGLRDGAELSQGDLNDDGRISLIDLHLLQSNLNAVGGGPNTSTPQVSEPATATVAAVAIVIVAGVRRVSRRPTGTLYMHNLEL